jgi:HAD superfamily hydrolase (TIGR01509 family)
LIRAIVFDFDGLILDTEEPIYRSWQELYEEHGVELPFERWVETVGTSTATFHPQHHLEEGLGRPLPPEVIDRRAARRSELVLAQQVLPGVLSHIESARSLGLKLGVASSSSSDWVAGHLERLGILGHFDCLRTRDDVAHVKPDPDLYVSVLDCLGAAACEAIAIEDSPNGIIAAKSAGLRCVAVPNPITAGLDLSRADLIVSSLSEVTLAQLLERLGMA